MNNTLESVDMAIPTKCNGGMNCDGCGLFAFSKGKGTLHCIRTLAAEVQRLRDERRTRRKLLCI